MTQVSGMKSAPASRLPLPLPRGKGGNQGYGSAPAPTKLELMQMQYQEKIKREKEKRMMEINIQNEERTMRFGDGPSRSVVKDFFKERREMANNGQAPNIERHFNQKKAEMNGQSSYSNQYQYKKQYGKPPSQRTSAGRDKSNPLAPIEKPPKGPDNGKKSRKSSAASNGSLYSQNSLPFPRKAGPLSRKNSFGSGTNTPINNRRELPGDISEDEERNVILSTRNASPHKTTSFKEWQEKQKRIREKQHLNNVEGQNEASYQNGGKMTDFQKWQAEQDQERSQRLQKYSQVNGYGTTPPPSNRSNASRAASQRGVAEGGQSPGRAKKQLLQKHINTQSKKHLYASSTSSKPVSGSDTDGEDEMPNQSQEMLKKQRELEALLRKQQEELQKMKKQREAEEEQDRLAREREEKRAAQQRERQRKLREAEAKKRREEEEEERERREKERKEQEKKELDERDMQWIQEQKQSMSRQNNYDNAYQRKNEAPVSHDDYEEEIPAFIPKKPAKVKVNRNKAPVKKQKNPSPEQDPEPFYQQQEDVSKFYLERAAEDPESHGKVDLAPCHMCGRKFARDRLDKHMKVCQSGQKSKRKVFDPVKMRVQGTEMAGFVAENNRHPQQEPPKKKNNWRSQHENFIQTIRYAKQVTEAEKTGDYSHVPAPPKTENPDYVQCPYCNRKFNEAAAERHIPRCKDIKSRPPPMKRR